MQTPKYSLDDINSLLKWHIKQYDSGRRLWNIDFQGSGCEKNLRTGWKVKYHKKIILKVIFGLKSCRVTTSVKGSIIEVPIFKYVILSVLNIFYTARKFLNAYQILKQWWEDPS